MRPVFSGEKPLRFWQKRESREREDHGDGSDENAKPGRKFFKFSPVADCEQEKWRQFGAIADERAQILLALFPAEVADGSLSAVSPAVRVAIPNPDGDDPTMSPAPTCDQRPQVRMWTSPHLSVDGLLFLAAVKRARSFDIFLVWSGVRFALLKTGLSRFPEMGVFPIFEREETFERYCLWPWGQRAFLVDVYVSRFWDVRVIGGQPGCEIVELSPPEILRPSWTAPDPTRPGTAVGIGMAAGTPCLWRFGDELEPLFSSAWAAEDRYARRLREKMLQLACTHSEFQEASSPVSVAYVPDPAGDQILDPSGEDFGEVEKLFSSPSLRERAEEQLRWADTRDEACRTIAKISTRHSADFGHLAVGPSGKIFVSCVSGFAVYSSDLRRLSTYSLTEEVPNFSSVGFASSIVARAGEEDPEIRVYAQIVYASLHTTGLGLTVRHFEVTEEVDEPPKKFTTGDDSLDTLLAWMARKTPAQREKILAAVGKEIGKTPKPERDGDPAA